MKVAINILPLKSAHKDRGIGYYTRNLIDALKKSAVLVLEFTDINQVKGVDLVHYPWFDLFFHTLPIKKSLPTVVTVHDVIPLIFKKHYPVGIRGRVNFLLQKLALKSCKQILTDSETSKADIIKFLKVQNEKVTAVSLGANKDFQLLNDTKLLYIKRKYNLPDRFLLYVGDANWVKNLPFLIEGFNEISKFADFRGFKLVLVGGVFLKRVEGINHPELESLKMVNRLIDSLYLDDKVIRPGNLATEELVGFYNLATIYVQPSFYEGFGLPILEAFSCGTPVVCSNRGSLPEVGGNAPVYFDPTNIRQFIAEALDILQNKSLQTKLSDMGLKRAKDFSWEKFAQQTKEVYLKCL